MAGPRAHEKRRTSIAGANPFAGGRSVGYGAMALRFSHLMCRACTYNYIYIRYLQAAVIDMVHCIEVAFDWMESGSPRPFWFVGS